MLDFSASTTEAETATYLQEWSWGLSGAPTQNSP
jgi:hypothetical protein